MHCIRAITPFVLLYLCINIEGFGQAVRPITGKVTDAGTGEPLPFVNVYIKGSTKGTATDFDGRFKIDVPATTDTLIASYIGYFVRKKNLADGDGKLMVSFQLASNDYKLDEVVIKPGENPAWPVMRRVIDNKNRNDKRSLTGYEYESYNKVEVDVDNLSDRFKRNKFVKKIKSVIDSIQMLAGEDGKPLIPIFLSETISQVYNRQVPLLQKEIIKKNKVTGIGIGENSLVNQIIGSSFQEYNFYRNWLNVFDKFFVSPIADGWKFYYDYELKDSVDFKGETCYLILFFPKRPQDLAFTGSMYITKADYAIKQIDAVIPKEANINFIEKFKIQQELSKTESGAWLPIKNRVLVDIAQVTKNSAGMLAKFYTSNRNIDINKPYGIEFYQQPVVIDEHAKEFDDNFWDLALHDSLSITERNVLRMIDTVKRLPVVKTYVEIANIAINGHKRVGKIDIGPYLYTYAWNNVEGHRFRIGFRTNSEFSKRLLYSGYLAYGTTDMRIKYGSNIEYIISPKRWTSVGIEVKEDVEQLALIDNSIAPNNLFGAFTRFGILDRSRPFVLQSYNIFVSSEIRKGISLRVGLDNKGYTFIPQHFDFHYFQDEDFNRMRSNFNTSEVKGEIRVAPDETFLFNDNRRISMGCQRWPMLIFRYGRGIKGFLEGDFDYNKFGFTIIQKINFGILGKGRYTIDAGYMPDKIPYPLLRAHLGNQTPFYNASSFNLMNYFEFVSDRYVQLGYQHFFEGLILNSIPIVRKWNMRTLATSNILVGHLSAKNRILASDPQNNDLPPIRGLSKVPYVEVGYGVENIFRLLRIDFIHRLTYRNNENISNFGIKGSIQFKI